MAVNKGKSGGWTPSEEKKLKKLIHLDLSLEQIADEMGRKRNSVYHKIIHLNDRGEGLPHPDKLDTTKAVSNDSRLTFISIFFILLIFSIISFLGGYWEWMLFGVIVSLIITVVKLQINSSKRSWTDNLTKSLVFLSSLGLSIDEIAMVLGRSRSSIRSKLVRENKYDDYQENLARRLNDDISKNASANKNRVLRDIQDAHFVEKPFVEMLIRNHEDKMTELKESYNHKNPKSKDEHILVNHSVLKTIAGFLNTLGGYLIIGVSDQQKIMGLFEDPKYVDDDSYIRSIEDKVETCLGKHAASLVDFKPIRINQDTILVISCKKSSRAVWCVDKDYNKRKLRMSEDLAKKHEILYVRRSRRTDALSGSDASEYERYNFSL